MIICLLILPQILQSVYLFYCTLFSFLLSVWGWHVMQSICISILLIWLPFPKWEMNWRQNSVEFDWIHNFTKGTRSILPCLLKVDKHLFCYMSSLALLLYLALFFPAVHKSIRTDREYFLSHDPPVENHNFKHSQRTENRWRVAICTVA